MWIACHIWMNTEWPHVSVSIPDKVGSFVILYAVHMPNFLFWSALMLSLHLVLKMSIYVTTLFFKYNLSTENHSLFYLMNIQFLQMKRSSSESVLCSGKLHHVLRNIQQIIWETRNVWNTVGGKNHRLWITSLSCIYTALLEKLKKAVVEGVSEVARWIIYQRHYRCLKEF